MFGASVLFFWSFVVEGSMSSVDRFDSVTNENEKRYRSFHQSINEVGVGIFDKTLECLAGQVKFVPWWSLQCVFAGDSS